MKPRYLYPTTLLEIEEEIIGINNNPDGPLFLQANSAGRRISPMHDASRLQMMATWARHSKEKIIHFHELANPESALEDLCGYSPGITALRLSKGVEVGEKKYNRRESLEIASEHIKNIDDENYQKLIKGRTIDLICVSGAKLQYVRPLFDSKAKNGVKDKSDMAILIKSISSEVLKQDKEFISENLIKACGVFIGELFLNTQEHACSDIDGNDYIEHVEGVIVGWKQTLEDQHEVDFCGHPRLKKFWENDLRESGKLEIKKSIRCLHLSIFDTGPGLAARLSGKHYEDMSLDEERNCLVECLKKHSTSKPLHGTGMGLHSVLEELQRSGGLLRIRSGRHSIFNAFLPNDKDVGLYDFQNWMDKPLGHAEGSVISLLIPIRREK